MGGGCQEIWSSPGPGPDSTLTLSGADVGAGTTDEKYYMNYDTSNSRPLTQDHMNGTLFNKTLCTCTVCVVNKMFVTFFQSSEQNWPRVRTLSCLSCGTDSRCVRCGWMQTGDLGTLADYIWNAMKKKILQQWFRCFIEAITIYWSNEIKRTYGLE